MGSCLLQQSAATSNETNSVLGYRSPFRIEGMENFWNEPKFELVFVDVIYRIPAFYLSLLSTN